MPDPIITPAAPPAWFAEIQTQEPEVAEYLTNKGWHDKDPATVVRETARSWVQSQKLIGAPPDQVIKLPKDPNDVAGWSQVYDRLGVPKDGKDYDFSTVKFADGTAVEPEVQDFFRGLAAKLKVTKGAAGEAMTEYVRYLERLDAAEKIDVEAKVAVEKDALAKSWGANANANLVVAQNAVKTLGIEPEAVAALEGQIGYSKVMEMFRNIGMKLGEGRFVTSESGGGSPGIMSQQAASDHLKALKTDEAFVKRWMSGDIAANREMSNTIRLASGLTDTITGT